MEGKPILKLYIAGREHVDTQGRFSIVDDINECDIVYAHSNHVVNPELGGRDIIAGRCNPDLQADEQFIKLIFRTVKQGKMIIGSGSIHLLLGLLNDVPMFQYVVGLPFRRKCVSPNKKKAFDFTAVVMQALYSVASGKPSYLSLGKSQDCARDYYFDAGQVYRSDRIASNSLLDVAYWIKSHALTFSFAPNFSDISELVYDLYERNQQKVTEDFIAFSPSKLKAKSSGLKTTTAATAGEYNIGALPGNNEEVMGFGGGNDVRHVDNNGVIFNGGMDPFGIDPPVFQYNIHQNNDPFDMPLQ